MGDGENREGILEAIGGVNGVGRLHDYDRWALDWPTFIELFKDAGAGRILGWEISRRSVTEDESSVRPHVYIIRGYMGLNDEDATEKTFNSLIDSIAAAFRADKTLGGRVLGHDDIQAEIIEARMFGSVLCHYAELSLTVYEHET